MISKTPKIEATISVNKRGNTHKNIVPVVAIPDTGAELSIAGKDLIKKLGLEMCDIRNRRSQKLFAANDTEIKVLGEIDVDL